MHLDWAAPEDDGGTPIYHYLIQYKLEDDYKWELYYPKERNPNTNFTIDKLKEDKVYEFRVAAENKVGTGPYSDPSEPCRTPIQGDQPEVMEPLKDLLVISPETAVFQARINPGEPRAKLTWYKDDKELKPNGKYDMSYEGDEAKLEITKTEAADSNGYKVKAVNKVGEITSEAQLTVHGKFGLLLLLLVSM